MNGMNERTIGSSIGRDTTRALLRLAQEVAPSGNQGEIYAARFEFTLGQLLEENKIQNWRGTEKNSEEDKQGIDYWILYQNEEFPVQITGTRDSHGWHYSGMPGPKRLKTSKFYESQGIIALYIRKKQGPDLKDPDQLKYELTQKLQRAFERKRDR